MSIIKILYTNKLFTGGIALFPFILIHAAHRNSQTILNHEKIHIQQQKELLILPFYIFYLLHYFINLVIYRNHKKAYLNIVFEREAYQNDTNMEYLKTRKLFAVLKYF